MSRYRVSWSRWFALLATLNLLLPSIIFGTGCSSPNVDPLPKVEIRYDDNGPWAPAEWGAIRAKHYSLRVPVRLVSAEPAVLVVPAVGLTRVVYGDIAWTGSDWPIHQLREGGADTIVVDYDSWFPVAADVVRFGRGPDLGERFVIDQAPAFAACSAIGLLGLMVLFGLLSRRPRLEYVWLALFSISISVVGLVELDVAVVLGVLNSRFALIHDSATFLTVASLCLFVAKVFDDRPKSPLFLLGLAMIAIGALGFAMHWAHLVRFALVRRFAYLGVVLFVVLSARLLVPLARKGDRAALILGVGSLLVVLLNVPISLVGLGVLSSVPSAIGPLGSLAFVMCLAKVLELQFQDNRARVQASSALLQQKVIELAEEKRATDHLNGELRRQVADRSRDLGTVLNMLPVAARAAPTLEPDAVVGGRYRVVRLLGAGAMGVVYEVERADDHTRFALKVMQQASTMAAVMRFTREAEIMAELVHPNLVSVVDVGIGGWGTPFFVMQLVLGGSLSIMREARFGDVEWALPVLAEIAHGLLELHEKGIVHRDLKPDNVLYDPSADEGSRIKIGDYGISRLGGGDGDTDDGVDESATKDEVSQSPSVSGSLTRTGALMGTPKYMAPELARSPATFASDVFAFGVMSIEILTARYPFPTVPVLTPGDRSITRDVAVPERVPASVAAILRACIAHDPPERPDALTIRSALR